MKMKRLLWKHYQIKGTSFLDRIADEPTSFDTDEGKEKEDERR